MVIARRPWAASDPFSDGKALVEQLFDQVTSPHGSAAAERNLLLNATPSRLGLAQLDGKTIAAELKYLRAFTVGFKLAYRND